MAKHLAIYSRISSRQQRHDSQLADLERWAAAQQLPVVWYKDTQSGKSMSRPGWTKLMSAVRSGKVHAICCWRLDRLGRTASGLTALFDELLLRQVNLVSMREGLDLSTPSGRLLANVIASLSQFETEIRGERVAAGQAAARAKGVRWGGSRPGRRKASADQLATIRQLHEQKLSVNRISKVVGLSRPTITRLLAE